MTAYRYDLQLVLDARTRLKKGQDAEPTYQEVLDEYKTRREDQLRAQQEKFYREDCTDENLQRLARLAVVVMELEIPTPPTYKLNQQLAYVLDKHIVATTPLAKSVLTSFWNDLEVELDITTNTILKSPDESPDAKGRALERYIIRKLEKERKINVHTKRIKWRQVGTERVDELTEKLKVANEKKKKLQQAKKPKEKDIEKVAVQVANITQELKDAQAAVGTWEVDFEAFSLSIIDFMVVHFQGDKLPPFAVDWTKSVLLVPDSFQYPDVDFILWDAINQWLVPAQITISNPVSDHSRGFFKLRDSGIPSDAWILLLQKNVPTFNSSNIKFLWVATNNSVTKDFDGEFIVELKSLDKTVFPLVHALRGK